MHRCGVCEDDRPKQRMHVFVDLNGRPYLLGEYMDRNRLQKIDRTAIVSGITVDTSDAMRAVIDIAINDIGERPDRVLDVSGNKTKLKRLLDMISRNATQLEGNLPVIKSGIVIRINYQLEVEGTGQVIRTMVEDLRIIDRNYFLDINVDDFNNNAVITNFCSSLVSTINEFTHGRQRMVIRITNVQMFYELVTDRHPTPRIKQSLVTHPYDMQGGPLEPGSNEEYYYHKEMQHHHHIGDAPGYEENSMLVPPHWAMFNEFYHFDQEGRRIILHMNEIYDPMRKTVLIPCGTVSVNRMFTINPGHRLIFKFSIWKNDVTAVFDTLDVAKALKAKFYDCSEHHHHHHHDDDHIHDCDLHAHYHERDREYHRLINMLYDERMKNEKSGKMISELLDRIKVLEDKLNASDPDNPPVVDPDDPITGCNCGCDEEHAVINEKIESLNQRIQEEDIDPMPEEVVEQIYQQVIDEREGEI